MVTNMKHASETKAAVQALNETIVKLTHVRALLADPAVLAAVKQVFQNEMPRAAVGSHSHSAEPGSYGANVRAAFEIVRDMGDEPFTKSDLAERLRQAGYEIGNPKTAMFYAMQKLLVDGVIERVQQGGGKRTNTYRKKVKGKGTEQPSLSADGRRGEGTEIGTATPVPKQLRLRNEMERVACECIARFNKPFAPHELINEMTATGFRFVGTADVSIQPCLRRLVKEEIIEIVQESDGRRAPIYGRRNPEQPRMSDGITSLV